MRIINRYILKEHVGPFVFALSALTSLLLLQYIARKFGDLVGRGLSWQVITEFLLLSVPFTLEMTLPMSVLVSVLYAFSRLAAENEVTALKAGGVSARSLMWPSLAWALLLSLFMVWFNDQLESRANHELATLQMAILHTKPTFALRPQIVNTVKEGQLYLRAGQIDQGSDHMHDVTIFDVSDQSRRRTIYADSGILAFAPNRKDLSMRLFNGMVLSAPTDKIGQLTRVYYREDALKVRDVANQFQQIDADTAIKGDREMSVCEMQRHYDQANIRVEIAQFDSLMAVWRIGDTREHHVPAPKARNPRKAGGIGQLYCTFITKYLHVSEASAAEVPRQDTTKKPQDTTKRQQDTAKKQQDTAKKPPDTAKGPGRGATIPPVQPQLPSSVFVMVGTQYIKVSVDKIPPNAYYPGGKPAGAEAIREAAAAGATGATPIPAPLAPRPMLGGAKPTPGPVGTATGAAVPAVLTPPIPPEIADAKARLDDARRLRNRFGIEIQKKFSLAAACLVFVLVGAPVALRFPRGGVGLVIGVSFFVFAVYYVGLIGGESLANKNLVSPFWAMWIDNIIFLTVGLLLLTRMGREGVTNRGGRLGEIIEGLRERFTRRGGRAA